MTIKTLETTLEERIAELERGRQAMYNREEDVYDPEMFYRLEGRLDAAQVILDLVKRVDNESEPGVDRYDPARC